MNFYDVILAGKLQDVTYPANFFDLLFARKLYPADVWEVYEGTLPAQFNANSDNMKQYQVWGNTGGVGDKTANLLDSLNAETGKFIRSDGVKGTSDSWAIYYIDATNGSQYTVTGISTVQSTAYIGYADDSKNILGVIGNAIDTESQTVTMPESGIFLAVSVRIRTVTQPMCVEGTTAPATYIPFGYEVDMGVKSGNLLDFSTVKNNLTLSSVNGLPSAFNGRIATLTPIDVSDVLSVTITYNSNYGNILFVYSVLAADDTMLFRENGKSSGDTIEIPTGGAKLYLSWYRGVISITTDNITQVMVSANPANKYQPYYNTTTPIYIGDEPLEKDEYIDYAEQKVFRRTAQVMPSAPAETKTRNGITVTCDGEGRYSISGTATANANVHFSLLTNFTIPISVGQGGNGTFSMFNTVLSPTTTIRFLNGETLIDEWSCNALDKNSMSYIAMGGKTVNAISFNISSGVTLNGVITPMFTDNSIPSETYIPYYQPTDPPVALPALPTCEGTTIVDYAGSGTAPEKVLFEYKKG